MLKLILIISMAHLGQINAQVDDPVCNAFI